MRKLLCLVFVLALAATAQAASTIYVYNWTEYMPDAVLKRFTAETGIKVKYATYESNEAMYAKLKVVKGKGYDVVVPSAYFVNRLRAEGLLDPLDKSALTNFKNIDPALLNKPHDPGNQFSVPYLWGTTAIGVDKAVVDPAAITSYEDLWKPQFKGKIALNDDLREVFGMALKICGHSINTTDPAKIKQAYDLLALLKPGIAVFNADAPRMPFLNKEVVIGLIWSGEVFMANNESGKEVLGYVYPKEGPMPWVDSMAIPKNAPNKAQAHTFINFILQPEIAKQISEAVGYATPNLEARKLLAEKVRTNPVVYPPAELIEKAEFTNDLGPAIAIYEKYWELLKTKK